MPPSQIKSVELSPEQSQLTVTGTLGLEHGASLPALSWITAAVGQAQYSALGSEEWTPVETGPHKDEWEVHIAVKPTEKFTAEYCSVTANFTFIHPGDPKHNLKPAIETRTWSQSVRIEEAKPDPA